MAISDSILMQLGNRITCCRERRGMTATDLAVQADVVPETISRIENGQRDIRYRNLCAIALALHVPLSSLQPEELDKYMNYSPDVNLLNENLDRLSLNQRQMMLSMFEAQIDSLKKGESKS